MRAAVQMGLNQPLEIRDDIVLDGVQPGQVRIRMRASGVCHSDLSIRNGTLPMVMPIVAGHEGAGEVVEVGPCVTSVQPGDHVVLSWVPTCGQCFWCVNGQPNLCERLSMDHIPEPNLSIGEVRGYTGLAGCFAEETILPERAVIPVAADIPFEIAALIGCGVITGFGAVVNTAQVRPGASVLVVGCGGVGMNVIQSARLAGAAEVVAVDPLPEKRELALAFGATEAAEPGEAYALSRRVGAGVGFDYAFEVVGRPQTIETAWQATRRGGTCTVVGIGGMDKSVEFSCFELAWSEKRLLGSYYGSSDLRRDIPRVLGLWRQGRLQLERLITDRIRLEDLNAAYSALERGDGLRRVVALG